MNYYIYGLVDPTDDASRASTVQELLASVIYVGKGTGNRMDEHGLEAQRLLAEDLALANHDADHGEKLNHLIRLYQANTPPVPIKLIPAIHDETDAYRAEAFAIEAVNAVRLAHGRRPLTNSVAGHGLAIEPLQQYFDRLNVSPVEVQPESGVGRLAILVKGTSDPATNALATEMTSGLHLVLAPPHRVRVMQIVGEGERRPAWDPHVPWSNEVAKERAQRYWPIDPARVTAWLRNPDTSPRELLLAVKDAGRTVIRYAWEIDPDGKWEYYPDFSGRWGIPVAKQLAGHPLLNTIPVVDGVGALRGFSSGIRTIRYTD